MHVENKTEGTVNEQQVAKVRDIDYVSAKWSLQFISGITSRGIHIQIGRCLLHTDYIHGTEAAVPMLESVE